ncbi:MAG: electron transport complex subunit RsxE [Nitrospirae bacterium RBG_19FT_COMBO_42_15]|nr:MAG: electron transport complex subunit RsxE [Nitrospirae bacterium RBG_19FT_COMBO_42_15]
MNKWNVFVNGIMKENPVLVLVIGLCPALAVSGSANDAFGMGIAATFVLIASNILISAVRKFTPDQIRIPIFIVIISTFVTIVDYTMHAADPVLYANLGVFVPLIVVNCIILGRAEAFAYRNDVLSSILDGIGMGIGFTLTLTVLGAVREIIGNGTITLLNYELLNLGEGFKPALMFIMPPGAFLVLGFLIALNRLLIKRKG